jgi:2-C-methyl-D-erythritol 4-phosphate cytidylyltransferase
MKKNKSIYTIIVAGGQGMRMGSSIPKQFLELNGKPILYYTISAFLSAVTDIHIVLVLPEQYISCAQTLIQAFEKKNDVAIINGGNTRYNSVKKGLALVPKNALVMVHDGVRPLVSKALILRCLDMAEEKGNAIPVVSIVDSMRMLSHDFSIPVDRSKMRIVQTPQTFESAILHLAFEQEYREEFTDEASVVESLGEKVYLVEGERNNIKITTPEDLIIASALMDNRL